MYITTYKSNRTQNQQINYYNISQNEPIDYIPLEFYKTTIKIDEPKPLNAEQRIKINYLQMELDTAYELIRPYINNCETQYYTFQIPKRSGGLRTINAPFPEFKEALSKVKDIFENKLKCLCHDSAYAYTKNRSVHTALQKHQANESNWFLKIDLKDFFPSCTPDFIYNQLIQLYPFYYFSPSSKTKLKEIILTCCLYGGLPQGTPMSPILTNLLMIPYDYTLYNYLKRGLGNHFVYTRYADDILISSKQNFNWQELQQKIIEILRPFRINTAKTRYGSKAGSNWNLGLMLNKDNNITLGYKKKKRINAMLNNFLNDFSNNVQWSANDTSVLQGQLSYLKHIEPDYYEHIVNKYENKHNLELSQVFKIIL